MSKNKIIVFDFDGTLVDSFYAVIEKFNLLANEFHFKSIHPNEIIRLKNLTSLELIAYLNIPIYKIPQIIARARKYMQAEILNLKPFPDLIPTLQILYEKQIHLEILTSNSQKNVSKWLQHYRLHQYFHCIHTEPKFFGKKYILKKIKKNYHKQKSQMYYIGDETRDIEAAKLAGIQSVAVTWGFNGEEILMKYQPNYLVKKPQDILSIFA